MANILGIVGSARGGKPCPINDDMAWLVDTVQAAEALVLAAPTYFLGPAAVVKLVLDRLLMVSAGMDSQAAPIRPAVTIITAGLADWRGVSLPYLNALVATFGFRPIESLNAIAPGPGEVLLDQSLMARALAAGERLGRGELDPAPAPDGVCPFCRCDSFILKENRAVCPICGQQAVLRQRDDGAIILHFDPADATEHRWTPEALQEHMESWVRATGPRFMAQRSEIKSRRQSYRVMEVSWLCPPSEAQPTRSER